MSEHEWRFYIADMLQFAENVLAYSNGLDQDTFVKTGLNYDATLRNLELIGKAATHVPDEIRSSHPFDTLAQNHRHPQPFNSWVFRH